MDIKYRLKLAKLQQIEDPLFISDDEYNFQNFNTLSSEEIFHELRNEKNIKKKGKRKSQIRMMQQPVKKSTIE